MYLDGSTSSSTFGLDLPVGFGGALAYAAALSANLASFSFCLRTLLSSLEHDNLNKGSVNFQLTFLRSLLLYLGGIAFRHLSFLLLSLPAQPLVQLWVQA